MTNKFYQIKSCRNKKLNVNVQQTYRKDVVLAAIFVYLKVKDTKDRLLSDILELITPKFCKNERKKNSHSNVEQSSMFHISDQDKYRHLKKKATLFPHLKIYMSCTDLNTTQLFSKNLVGVLECQILSPPLFPVMSSTRFCI